MSATKYIQVGFVLPPPAAPHFPNLRINKLISTLMVPVPVD